MKSDYHSINKIFQLTKSSAQQLNGDKIKLLAYDEFPASAQLVVQLVGRQPVRQLVNQLAHSTKFGSEWEWSH